MLLLAFESSAKAASVALFNENGLLDELFQNAGLTHSQTLMVMAEDLLKKHSLTPAQISAVAVANGPGSFTGVRIGAAAAKGFAWGAQVPLYGVSTLEAMALGAGIENGYICCTMDARRAQVYNALFYVNQRVLTRLCPDRAISLEELGEELKKFREPIFIVGDGSILCYNTLSKNIDLLVCPDENEMHQRAKGVGMAALQAMNRSETTDAASLTPNYLRLSQAEREKRAREQR